MTLSLVVLDYSEISHFLSNVQANLSVKAHSTLCFIMRKEMIMNKVPTVLGFMVGNDKKGTSFSFKCQVEGCRQDLLVLLKLAEI